MYNLQVHVKLRLAKSHNFFSIWQELRFIPDKKKKKDKCKKRNKCVVAWCVRQKCPSQKLHIGILNLFKACDCTAFTESKKKQLKNWLRILSRGQAEKEQRQHQSRVRSHPSRVAQDGAGSCLSLAFPAHPIRTWLRF